MKLEKDKLKDTIKVASQVLGEIAFYIDHNKNKELTENRIIDSTKVNFAKKYDIKMDYKSLLEFLCIELHSYKEQERKTINH